MFFTILTPIIISLGVWGFNAKTDSVQSTLTAHSDANVATLKQAITESYETQIAHSKDMDAMSVWNKALAQGQHDLSDKVDKNNVEQRLAIQHVSDKIESLTSHSNNN
jgi:hypothetical protein